jgi:hypothetical protein
MVAGEELMKIAGLREAAAVTPLVLLTPHQLPRAAVQAAGFGDLLDKPFDLGGVERPIRALFPRGSSTV